MSGRVEGKVAFITGAARGQGCSHAIRLAEEGADIIAVDIAAQVDSVPYPMATPEDLAQTVKEVKALDRRIVATQADVRDYDALKAAVDDGVAQLGRLDIVSANAGIVSYGRIHELAEQTWRDIIDINLTGVWHTAKATIPHLIQGGRGGSIVITSSDAGLMANQNTGHYVSANRPRWPNAQPGARVGAEHDQSQLAAPDIGQHPHDPERSHVQAVSARPRAPDGRRRRRGVHQPQRPADQVGRADRHLQRPPVPGLRRGPVHNRCPLPVDAGVLIK